MLFYLDVNVMPKTSKIKHELMTLNNVGPAIYQDLLKLDINTVAKLAKAKADELYQRLQQITGQKQDPCVWDVFAAIIYEAKTGIKRPWWHWSGIRKQLAKNQVIIGKGDLAGKGVYANRNFKKDEVVIQYHLLTLTEQEYQQLPESERMFTHLHWGQTKLYFEPERYVNHSDYPNTYQDLTKQCDIALRDINKGEMITGDATKDDTDRCG
jgi:hypothetical protein